jgi:hypothetical protein
MRTRLSRTPARGYISLPAVTALTIMLTLGVLMIFKRTLLHRDQAARTQLRADYHQREEILLRAIVAALPGKAADCMKASHADESGHSWSAVFEQALAISSAGRRLSPELRRQLGLQSRLSGDVADEAGPPAADWITSLTGEPGRVTPGTTDYAEVFANPAFAGKVPPLLAMPAALQEADAQRPIISPQKRYAAQVPGLLADVAAHPFFNLIPYPNIRFGYAAPGQPFVARRNWWAFSVNYGGRGTRITRHYVLSLYEIPSQMPIEAAAFAAIGAHQDGTAWNAGTVSIEGSVIAARMRVDGAYGADRLAGRESIELSRRMEVGGVEIGADFDALGERERLQIQQGSDALPVALSANSGRLTFLPLPTGPAYLRRPAGETSVFDDYTAGAGRCRVVVEAVRMVSLENQTPVEIRVTFQAAAGGQQQVVLRRDDSWPTVFEPGGDAIPFQTELTSSSRSCLTFSPALLHSWLLARGGAGVDVNSSLHFTVNTAADPDTVRALSDPPAPEDMCVIIRKGKDLTGYPSGLSIVTPLRVYVGDDLNAVPAAAAPAGSGLGDGAPFYPPLSIFAAELRVGTTGFNRPIDHHGQLGSLAAGGASAWQPLDMKSGSDDAVHTDSISARLTPLGSPAELPPVHPMNWLVLIEEIPQD